jgi:hypothetical protein
MSPRWSFRSALVLATGVAGATLIPYLVAPALARSHGTFVGFLLNPVDGFSYLAKMRQGACGSWLFTLPYAAAPGPGTLLYPFYLLLGHLAAWTHLPLPAVYHSARVAGAVAMFMAAFRFYQLALWSQHARRTAYLLTLLGSGLGWLLLPLGVLTPDLWVPEAIPFLTAYTNAHFPWAAAALLGGTTAILRGLASKEHSAKPLVQAAACGLLLGAIQPFSVISLLAVLGVWLVWEGQRAARQGTLRHRRPGPGLVVSLAFLGGALPWSAYAAWTTRVHPVLAGWTAQNQTPSPPPYLFAAGYGVVFLLALAGMLRARPHDYASGRLLITWTVVNTLLLYAPLDLQRRLYLGLFFPFAALAAVGLEAWSQGRPRLGWALVLVLILAIPSNLVVVAVGLNGVARGEPALILAPGEVAAYRWLGDHAEAGAVVLASPTTGNRLPAFADVRVLYGHPFETPHAQAQETLVEDLLVWDGDPQAGLSLLSRLGVQYVLYGAAERSIGSPSWLASLPVAYDHMGVQVLPVVDAP